MAVLLLSGFVLYAQQAHAFSTKDAATSTSASRTKVLAFSFSPKDVKKYDEVDLPRNAQTLSILQAPKNIDPQAKSPNAVLVVNDTALSGENVTPSGSADGNEDYVPTSDQISKYVVRPGDTLEQIALMYDVNVATIRLANDLSATEKIQPGQVLVILPVAGVRYVTKAKGDTIARIAKSYGADMSRVSEFNGIPSNQTLDANVAIIIPDAEDVTGPGHEGSKPSGSTTTKPGKTPAAPSKSTGKYFSCPVPNGMITQGIHGHNGIDIGAPNGTPIYAAADGEVIIARSGGWGGGYGTYAVVKHGNGTQTLYGHASVLLVSEGDYVKKGQMIARVGSTGDSTGNHLHVEVRGGTNNLCSGLKRAY
jgi:murein DD-endopeptidase MepM/ murein hydrolase activator NlpD